MMIFITALNVFCGISTFTVRIVFVSLFAYSGLLCIYYELESVFNSKCVCKFGKHCLCRKEV